MTIKEILNNGQRNLSFEVFPPKTDDAFQSVESAVLEIAKLQPPFMSVTYGAGGGTSQYTLALAQAIRDKYGVASLAHLTCVSSTKETVKQRICGLMECGIENVMALRGDLLPGMDPKDSDSWDYHHAVDLIRELKAANPGFCVGGACYPEVHPESPSRKTDITHLKEKVDAGADFLTTQMFFDNDIFYRFLYQIREAGITVPVVAGIMPITNAKQLRRSIQLSGCSVPKRFLSVLDQFGKDPAAMKQAGIAYATDQIIDLYANGIRNVHVYSMNNADVAQKIQANLSQIIAKPAL